MMCFYSINEQPQCDTFSHKLMADAAKCHSIAIVVPDDSDFAFFLFPYNFAFDARFFDYALVAMSLNLWNGFYQRQIVPRTLICIESIWWHLLDAISNRIVKEKKMCLCAGKKTAYWGAIVNSVNSFTMMWTKIGKWRWALKWNSHHHFFAWQLF